VTKIKKLKYLLEYAFIVCTYAWANILPAPWAVAVGGMVGRLVHALWGRRRRIAQVNLRLCFPEADERWVKRVARRSFVNFAKAMIDYGRIPRLNPDNLGKRHTIVNRKSFDDALAAGKGALLFTGHFGSWEQTGAAIRLSGYPINYLVGEQHNKRVDDFMNGIRAGAGIGLIHIGAAAKGVFKILRANGMVALLSDQDAGADGVIVEFFGQPASTPRGPAAFVARTGAAICAGFTVRDSNRHNTLYMQDVIEPDITGDADVDIANITQLYTDLLEKYCRQYPDHYHWMHRRFKSTRSDIYEY
jgi:KDO2-lipid IV(A) lauroyltransferase